MLPRASPKLRQSCNDCLSAKVKCEKQKPACDRCLRAGKPCVYSLSRKTGRPSSKRNDMHNPRTPPTILAAKPSNEGLCTTSLFDQWVADTSASGPDPPAGWDDFSLDRLDSLIWSNDQLPLLDEQTQHQWPSMFTPPTTQSGDEKIVEDASSFHLPGTCQFANVPAPLDALIHGCDYEASAVLSTLNCTDQINVKTELSSEASWDNVTRLDNILQRNKSAVSRMTQLLDCSCAQEPHLAMLYASIVSKIIAWYQVAARQLLVPPPLTTTSTQSGSTSSLSLDSEMSGVQPSSTGIRIGSFEPDTLDQAALHRQLLLIEICKVDTVIDKMLAASRQPWTSGRDPSMTIKWYDLACQSAKSRLQETKDLISEILGG